MITSQNVRAAFCLACRAIKRHEKRGVSFFCECGKERTVIESAARLPLPFKPTKSLEGRFHDATRQTPYCWIWEGSYHINGKKPQLKMRSTQVNATYMSWYLATGCWPKGWIIRTCVNIKCVNPEHLVEGSRADWGKIRSLSMRINPPKPKAHCSRGHRFPEHRIKNGDKWTCHLCRLITNRRNEANRQMRRAAKRLEAKGWNMTDFQAHKAQETASECKRDTSSKRPSEGGTGEPKPRRLQVKRPIPAEVHVQPSPALLGEL